MTFKGFYLWKGWENVANDGPMMTTQSITVLRVATIGNINSRNLSTVFTDSLIRALKVK